MSLGVNNSTNDRISEKGWVLNPQKPMATEKNTVPRQPDRTDLRILDLLQDHGKWTNKEIAARLAMSITPVYERIKRLEEEGYIERYVTILNREKLGSGLIAFCNVSLKEHSKPLIQQFEAEVQSLEEVQECFHVAGQFDYFLKVITFDMKTYQDFIVNRLAALDNIRQVQSSFILTEVKKSWKIPLGPQASR